MTVTDLIADETRKLRDFGTLRGLPAPSDLIDFASNDYLGLAANQSLRQRVFDSIQALSLIGSTGSRLISGNSAVHLQTETTLARLYDFESALLFGSGYAANLGVISAFRGLPVHFFSDELNHASLIDGMRLSSCEKSIFRHNDCADLAEKLRSSRCPQKIIVTESLFSMDGDLSPLEEIVALARQFNALLVVDEAHSTGVLGPSGRGRLAEIDVRDVPVIALHTGGKALGACGAFVLSSETVRSFLVNNSRSFIYSTAMTPLSARQLELSALFAAESDDLRATLQRNIRQLELVIPNLKTQIAPVIFGSNPAVVSAESNLNAKGFFVKAIRSPTVARGFERLRITIRATQTREQIQQLTCALGALR